MLNFDINEFQLISNQSSPATMKLTKDFIMFSKTIVYRLKNPEYIQVLVQREKKLVIIRPCSRDAEEAIPFAKKPYPETVNLRRRGVLREIGRMIIGFDPDVDSSVCLDGEYYEEGNLFLFNAREYYFDRRELHMPGMDNVLSDQISGVPEKWS